MDKKIKDMFDKINKIDIRTINNEIDLDDKEIDEILANKDINYSKIKNNIFNNNFVEIKNKKRIFLLKNINIKPLIAAILIICLSCSVYAYNKGYLEAYFGKNSEKIDEGRIHIELNQESDGIVLKSADVISGETDANILLAFQKKDGKPFEMVPLIGYDEISLSGRKGSSGDGFTTKMSADDTVMTALIEIGEDNKPLKGRTVDINIDSMISRNSNKYICDIDLYELYKNNPINITMSTEEMETEQEKIDEESELLGKLINEESFSKIDWSPLNRKFLRSLRKSGNEFVYNKIEVPQEITEFVKSINLTDIVFINNVLYIGQKSDCLQENKSKRSTHITGLYDTRTKEKNYASVSSYQEPFSISEFESNKNIKPEDLKYLKPIIVYEEEKTISEGVWNFSYTFNSNSSGFYFSKDINIERDVPKEGKIRLTKIEIKPLSFDIICERPNYEQNISPVGGASEYKVKVKLNLDNGEIVELLYGGGKMIGDSGKYFKYIFCLPDKFTKEDELDFFNSEYLEHINSIEIDNTEIQLRNNK